jgi:hypothetical protein
MGTALHELNKSIKNMIFMRKMKGITVQSSQEALGIVPAVGDDDTAGDEGQIIALWGSNPVHPTSAAYRELAAKIA